MKMHRNFSMSIVSAAFLVSCFLFQAIASGQIVKQRLNLQRRDVKDIKLREGGVLLGNVIGADGKVHRDATVVIKQKEKVLAVIRTNTRGQFGFKNLKGGIYQIQTQRGDQLIRVWSKRAAPPSSLNSVVVVEGDSIVRGQNSGSPFAIAPADVLFWGLVGAGVGIPVALADEGS